MLRPRRHYVDWCTDHAKRALRKGDVVTAERWYKVADRAQLIEQRKQRMAYEESRPVYPRFVGS